MTSLGEAQLLRAIERRKPLTRSLEAFRLFDGPGDGAAGVFIDKFGMAAVIHETAGGGSVEAAELRALCSSLAAAAHVRSVYYRRHDDDPRVSSRREPELLFGGPVEELTVREGRPSYYVRPLRNVNCGLFLDTRAVRALIAARSRGKRVLNTFCFTGSLGTAAFAGGAAEVTQIDVSKPALTWARENFELNRALGAGSMRFIPEDARVFLQREARRIERGKEPYDMVVLDPPAFGRSGGKPFSVKNDLEDLVAGAMAVLAAGGSLVLSTNVREVSEAELSEVVRKRAAAIGRKIAGTESLPRPEDFTAKPEESSVMRGVWATLG